MELESRTRWTPPDDDARLEAIIEAVVDDLATGVAVDVESVAAAHPEFAARLRELLPMVFTMADLGGALEDAGALVGALDRSGGERKLGDFRIIRELGRGGMGTVFEAEQLSMGRCVALKVLPFAALANEKSLQRFKNEVRAAAALDHPHIVSVYSVGEDRGVHFYAMQLIRGQTLAEHIERLRANRDVSAAGARVPSGAWEAPTIDAAVSPPSTQPLALARLSAVTETHSTVDHCRLAARLGIQAAEALQHAHDQGVLHRDVKPGNLMLDRDGKLYITDFGLARIEADAGLTMTGDLLGTLRYMPPEQALGKPVVIDHRADVYSLGASLYELATLEPAFGESARAELLKQIAFDEPRRMHRIDRGIPTELESIVLKAMAKEPQERYQSAQLMADDLRAFVDLRPIKARPASIHDRLRKWSRRHQTLAITLVVTLSALSVILAASMYVVSRARDSAVSALEQSADSAARLADQLYDADLSLAYQYWEKGWSNEVPALLDRHRLAHGGRDRRGYEWRLLNSLTKTPKPLVLAGHDGPVNEIAVFPGGRRIASVGDDGTLRLWDARRGTLLATLDISAFPLHAVAVSPDGRRVAVANDTVYLYDLEHGQDVVEIFRGKHNVESLAFSPDGASLAAGVRYHEVCLLSLDGAVLQRTPCESRVESLEFLPQSQQLIVPNRSGPPEDPTGSIQLWRDDATKIDAEFAIPSTLGFMIARPSACGKYVAAAARYGAKVAFLDVASRKTIIVLPSRRDQATDVCFSPDGLAAAASYGDGAIQYFRVDGADAESFCLDDRVQTWGAHRGAANAVRFLAPGLCATCGNDGLIRVWNVRRVETTVAKRFSITEMITRSASLSPDGKRVFVVTNHEALILDGDNGSVLFRQPQPDLLWARTNWAPRSDLTATWSGPPNEIKIRTPDCQVAAVIPSRVAVEDVVFAPDGRSIAIIGENLVRLADVRQGKTLFKRRLPDLGHCLAFANRADILAIGGRFSEVILATTDLRRLHRSLPSPSDATCLAFNHDDSMLASGHSDGVVRIWDVEAGALLGEIIGHNGSITNVIFTRDGRALLSSAHDSTIRIASIRDFRSIGVVYLRSAPDRLMCRLTASSDNSRLAAFVYRSHNNQPDVLLWNIEEFSAD